MRAQGPKRLADMQVVFRAKPPDAQMRMSNRFMIWRANFAGFGVLMD
jgi:hypothetical protein